MPRGYRKGAIEILEGQGFGYSQNVVTNVLRGRVKDPVKTARILAAVKSAIESFKDLSQANDELARDIQKNLSKNVNS